MRRGDGLYLRNKTWYLVSVIDGTRHQVKLGRGITRRTALEIAQVQRGAIIKGELNIGKKKKDLTFDDARTRFETWVRVEKRATTTRGYVACLDELAKAFGGKRLSQITPWSLEAYKKERGEPKDLTDRPAGVSNQEWARRCRVAKKGAPIRCNRELAVLKTLYNKCRDWGLHELENPVSKIKFKKELRTRLRFLEPDEEALLVAAASEPLRTLILVGIHCGLRLRSEAMSLQWSDVDLVRKTVTVQASYAKNGKTRTVPLNSVVKAALATLQQTAVSDSVFAKRDGSPYRSIRVAFQAACKRATVMGVTPHTLRHTFASRLVMSGADLKTVMELGGWATLSMVERYAHLSPAHKADAVERIARNYSATSFATPEQSMLAVVP